MKIIIIGIDGLEYNLVELLELKNLMQKYYGKIDIPQECFIEVDTGKVPYTPKVWEVLLTGEKPYEEETKSIWIYKNSIIEKLRWMPLIKKIKGKRLLLRKLGIKLERRGFRISRKTFLDKCKPTVYINIPGINAWDDDNMKINELIDDGKLGTLWIVLEKYMNNVFNEFQEKVSKTDYKIGMMYINTLDYIGHLCWYKCFNRIIKLYKKVDKKVGQLLNTIDYDISLIISDHGMKGSPDGVTGQHTHYLFYSINIDYKFSNIYEIPKKIIEWCNK